MDEALQSQLLSEAGVRHAFFTRHGGVSQGIYASLNLGRGSKDDPQSVAENWRRAAAVFGGSPQDVALCFQVHLSRVVQADAGWGDERPRADGVVTASDRVIAAVLTADCAPILIADPHRRVIGAVHAGWRGALGGVIAQSVAAMARLGAHPDRMIAAVGPCIAQQSYEVGPEFTQAFVAVDPAFRRFFKPGPDRGRDHFDLPGFTLDRLAEAGVRRAEWIGRDTCAEEGSFFSNRRAVLRGEPDYGRLGSAIMLD